MTDKIWKPDPAASFERRMGMSPQDPSPGGGTPTGEHGGCPDIWEMSSGDVAVIGRDLTESYRSRLPDGVSIVGNERLVIIPRSVIIAAKADIPDA